MPQRPFESHSSVPNVRDPEDARKPDLPKNIVVENFGNLMILAGHLNLIQSKLSIRESF